MKNYRRLLRFLKPYIWPHFTVAMICMLLYSATSGVLPFLTKRIFDDVFSSRNQATLTFLPFVIIAVFGLRGLVSFGENYLMTYINGHIITDIRNALHGHILSLSISFFHRNSTGSLISRLTNDVGLVSLVLTYAVLSLMRASVCLTSLAIAPFVLAPFVVLFHFFVVSFSFFFLIYSG